MNKKIYFMVVLICMAVAPAHAAGKAESLEEGIEQLAVDISAQMKAKGIKKIAIDDFTDLNGYKSALGDFISEELVTNFYTHGAGSFEVVERRELARVLKEQELGGSGLLDKDTIAKVGEVLGIDAIVTGSIAYLGRHIKVNARMLGVNDAKVFAATSQKMPKDETVESLLTQAGRTNRVTSPHLVPATASGAGQFGTIYQDDFIVARPTSFLIDGNDLVLNLELQNKTNKKLFVACSRSIDSTIVGNFGYALSDDVSSTSQYPLYAIGIPVIGDKNAKSKTQYNGILPNSKMTVVYRFSIRDDKSKSNLFSIVLPMYRHSGSGSDYSLFKLQISDIPLYDME